MIRHLASVSEIVIDLEEAVRFYRDSLGLTVQHEPGSLYAQVDLGGVLHFGLWDRRAAAEAAFGDPAAAERVPLGFSVGFEVDAVEPDRQALAERGAAIVQGTRREPWGQVTSRFLSPSGALCELAETPWARRIAAPLQAAQD